MNRHSEGSEIGFAKAAGSIAGRYVHFLLSTKGKACIVQYKLHQIAASIVFILLVNSLSTEKMET